MSGPSIGSFGFHWSPALNNGWFGQLAICRCLLVAVHICLYQMAVKKHSLANRRRGEFVLRAWQFML